MFPIVFFLSYLGFTILLFVVGPWEYSVTNPVQLYLFLFLSHLALLLGYLKGASGAARGYSGKWQLQRLVLWSALATLTVFFPTSLFRTGHALPDVVYGLTYPGEAYAVSQDLRHAGEPLVEYLRIFLGPLLGFLLPLTVFYWPRLTHIVRVIGVAGILSTVALFIAMGTNKAIADTVLLVPLMVISSHFARVIKLNWKRIVGLAVAAACALLLFLLFFGNAVSSREGSAIVGGYFPAGDSSVDSENLLVGHLNDKSAMMLEGLDMYLTQGYYALSLSLREPFVPMFGVGNSMFLLRQIVRITGDERITEMSYPARIEKYGWDAEGLWSSIYPWIASDVSFPGTILVVYLIGRLFALSWLDTLGGANPFGVVLFSQFVIMLFYFPANNQLLQAGEGFTAFWGTLILWQLTRRRVLVVRSHAQSAAVPA